MILLEGYSPPGMLVKNGIGCQEKGQVSRQHLEQLQLQEAVCQFP